MRNFYAICLTNVFFLHLTGIRSRLIKSTFQRASILHYLSFYYFPIPTLTSFQLLTITVGEWDLQRGGL